MPAAFLGGKENCSKVLLSINSERLIMYAYLEGKLSRLTPSYAVIEANGVGYKIAISQRTFQQLNNEGEKSRLYTSFIVREDFQGLYGFDKEEERDLFEMLITISGIGPKMGMNLLSHLSFQDLHNVILEENAAALSKIPGIGKKTADRLMVELRNKLEHFTLHAPQDYAVKTAVPLHPHWNDALKALMTLGYNSPTAHKALKKTLEADKNLDLSRLIAAALKHV
jgi:Holliday junction DNA helicase RuvA